MSNALPPHLLHHGGRSYNRMNSTGVRFGSRSRYSDGSGLRARRTAGIFASCAGVTSCLNDDEAIRVRSTSAGGAWLAGGGHYIHYTSRSEGRRPVVF